MYILVECIDIIDLSAIKAKCWNDCCISNHHTTNVCLITLNVCLIANLYSFIVSFCTPFTEIFIYITADLLIRNAITWTVILCQFRYRILILFDLILNSIFPFEFYIPSWCITICMYRYHFACVYHLRIAHTSVCRFYNFAFYVLHLCFVLHFLYVHCIM